MARLSTPLCELLGIRVPVIQAPMAGGPSFASKLEQETIAALRSSAALIQE